MTDAAENAVSDSQQPQHTKILFSAIFYEFGEAVVCSQANMFLMGSKQSTINNSLELGLNWFEIATHHSRMSLSHEGDTDLPLHSLWG